MHFREVELVLERAGLPGVKCRGLPSVMRTGFHHTVLYEILSLPFLTTTMAPRRFCRRNHRYMWCDGDEAVRNNLYGRNGKYGTMTIVIKRTIFKKNYNTDAYNDGKSDDES